jgi:hypothetical protein
MRLVSTVASSPDANLSVTMTVSQSPIAAICGL